MHGTCVALGGACALLRGRSGCGKSDLALRFLFLHAKSLRHAASLVADDQVFLRSIANRLIASPPPSLAGKIEVRGIGIVQIAGSIPSAELRLLVDLDKYQEITRFPEGEQFEQVLGFEIPRIALDPFEPSAPIKLALALQNFFGNSHA